jgi:hypothetical protein
LTAARSSKILIAAPRSKARRDEGTAIEYTQSGGRMATNIVTHADGKKYRREFVTGRTPTPIELHKVRRNISLDPALDQQAETWEQRTGMKLSRWIEMKMLEEIHTKTV